MPVVQSANHCGAGRVNPSSPRLRAAAPVDGRAERIADELVFIPNPPPAGKDNFREPL